MSLFLLTALFATVQAAVITLHPNGDTSYCLDGRNTPGNGHNGPIITHTYVVSAKAADREIPLRENKRVPDPLAGV